MFKVIEQIQPLDREAGEQVAEYLHTLTKPKGSLGRLEEIAVHLAQITGHPFPKITPPGMIVMAADHGVSAEGVSAYPQEVTAQMVQNFLNGGAAINVFAKQIGALVDIVDIGVAQKIEGSGLIDKKIRYGTRNMLKENAMTREEALESIQVGIEVAEDMICKGVGCFIPGEMGIANTTSSSAMLAAFLLQDRKFSGSLFEGGANHLLLLDSVVGSGTGIDQEQVLHKKEVIRQALEARKPNPNDPIDVLMKVGGLEIGGLTGMMLAAAGQRIPIVVDGLISTVAALVAEKLCPLVTEYMLFGHRSAEPGHQTALEWLGKEPLLDLHLRLGEGTGAALAFPLLDSATNMLRDMATFKSAKVYTSTHF